MPLRRGGEAPRRAEQRVCAAAGAGSGAGAHAWSPSPGVDVKAGSALAQGAVRAVLSGGIREQGGWVVWKAPRKAQCPRRLEPGGFSSSPRGYVKNGGDGAGGGWMWDAVHTRSRCV